MGFGIAFLGYCFQLLHSAGFGLLAAPFLAYGFFLASRLEKRFLYASVSALFMLPRGLFVLLDLFLPVLGVNVNVAKEFPLLNLGTYLLFFIAWVGLMGLMGWYRKHKFSRDDAHANWTAQIINAVGQTCLLLGILLAG